MPLPHLAKGSPSTNPEISGERALKLSAKCEVSGEGQSAMPGGSAMTAFVG